MRPSLCATIAAWLLTVSAALAQSVEQLPAPELPAPTEKPLVAPVVPDDAVSPIAHGNRPLPGPPGEPLINGPTQPASAYPYVTWFRGEFLTWWIKNAPPTPPLVTTGSASAATPAVLGAGGTVLFGNDEEDFGTFAGGRWTLGTWWGLQQMWGFEVTGLALERRTLPFEFLSTNAGLPVIGRPFVDAQTGQETVVYAAFPNRFAGGVIVDERAKLWGLEGDAICRYPACGGPWFVYQLPFGDLRLQMVGGFRYLDLRESLYVAQASALLPQGVANFAGLTVVAPNAIIVSDSFVTSNRFYGGEAGARAEFTYGSWFADLTGKLAMGATHELLVMQGASALAPIGQNLPIGVTGGGLLATSTNIGRYKQDVFAVLPEVGLNLGYQYCPELRFFVGFTFLYWSNVILPESQVDRTVNLTQVPINPNFGTLTGPSRPAPQFHTTDFWAGGLSFGIELRF